MNNKKFTYEKSGVNITAADKFIDFLSKKAKQSKNKSKFIIPRVTSKYGPIYHRARGCLRK